MHKEPEPPEPSVADLTPSLALMLVTLTQTAKPPLCLDVSMVTGTKCQSGGSQPRLPSGCPRLPGQVCSEDSQAVPKAAPQDRSLT